MNRTLATIVIHALVLAGLLTIASGTAGADDNYPSKPIRIILPQPAGGAVDLISRVLGDRLSEQLKQPVIVESMPGASGALAASFVARATPDGHTLFLTGDNTLVVNPYFYPNLTYDSFKDFAPISILTRSPMAQIATQKLPVTSVRELIAYAKANPGKLNYASIGLGTTSHLGMELLKHVTQTQINMVPYRGTAPATTDIVAGVVDVMFTGPPSGIALSQAGQVKLLAFASLQRFRQAPEIPTMSEAGVPGYEMATWFGVLAPAKTPKPLVERISREVGRAVADPQFSERLIPQGMEIIGSTPAEMLDAMRRDSKRWGDLVKATGANHAPQ